MSDVAKPALPPLGPGQIPVSSHKVLRASSEEPPIFINSAEFSGMGMEVYMDVGVVPVESVAAAAKIYQDSPDKPAPVDFHVSFRFGMSLQAALLIHQRLTQLLEQSAAQTAALMQQHAVAPHKDQKP